MWLAKLALFLALAYAGIVAAMYFAQTALLFPTWLAPATDAAVSSPAVPLETVTPDGERLRGIRIPGAPGPDGERVVVIGFGGNAWNATDLAAYLHQLYPKADVVAFHYRGYSPSGGRPSAAALLADAPVIYDHVATRPDSVPIIAVGISIGSGVAAHLAKQRPLAGLILVSPFDSLEALGREHYWWLPVHWLLRHRMEVAEDLRGTSVPTAIIAAERDDIVPPRRTERVRRAIRNLVLDLTIAGAGHNDLFQRPEFRAAMVEALARIRRGIPAPLSGPQLPRQ
jgi:hypothetical protein